MINCLANDIVGRCANFVTSPPRAKVTLFWSAFCTISDSIPALSG